MDVNVHQSINGGHVQHLLYDDQHMNFESKFLTIQSIICVMELLGHSVYNI